VKTVKKLNIIKGINILLHIININRPFLVKTIIEHSIIIGISSR